MYLALVILSVCTAVSSFPSEDYWTNRAKFIQEEESEAIGSAILLSEKEERVNRMIMNYKEKECDQGFNNPSTFLAGKHFFHAKRDIEKTKVFKFIQLLPKGAALHGHDTALVSEEYLYTITLRKNLYACAINGRLKMIFMTNSRQDESCDWKLMSVLRKQDPSYDDWVRSQITLNVPNPNEKYPSINDVWSEMNDIFETVEPLVTYKPVFQEYFYQALKELYDDNVMYLEFRSTLPTVYEIDGSTFGPLEVAGMYCNVIKQFKNDHPDFLGARLIYAPVRNIDNATMTGYIDIVKTLKKSYPKFLAGFDLVGQEDIGRPLNEFVEELKNVPSDINFLFHSAETNWYGSSTDQNLVDAILMGTKRIGHGYGLTKHPLVMKLVKERGIAIEVCPISNQVLKLVEDIRNHPASVLISQGFPVVISYDDPSFWSTKGLSYDFYMTFMGIASRNADLKLLKQLSKNSIMYSMLPDDEKEMALAKWERQWDNFIETFSNSNNLKVSCSVLLTTISFTLINYYLK